MPDVHANPRKTKRDTSNSPIQRDRHGADPSPDDSAHGAAKHLVGGHHERDQRAPPGAVDAARVDERHAGQEGQVRGCERRVCEVRRGGRAEEDEQDREEGDAGDGGEGEGEHGGLWVRGKVSFEVDGVCDGWMICEFIRTHAGRAEMESRLTVTRPANPASFPSFFLLPAAAAVFAPAPLDPAGGRQTVA